MEFRGLRVIDFRGMLIFFWLLCILSLVIITFVYNMGEYQC